jgi:hypothetical protein
MIDNRTEFFPKKRIQPLAQLCDRRFGIGDGLILLENDLYTDFKMVYYNSDGNQSSHVVTADAAFAKSFRLSKTKLHLLPQMDCIMLPLTRTKL